MTPIQGKLVTKAALCCLGLLALGGGWLCRVGVPPWNSAAARAAEPARNKCAVPSERDGILLVIGTEIKEGEKVPDNQVVKVSIDGEEKQFRRLRVGDRVERGQLLARLDDRLARIEVAIKESKVEMAEAERLAAEKTRDEAKKRVDAINAARAQAPRAVTEQDAREAQLTLARYIQEEIARQAGVRQARLELKPAKIILAMHEVRSPVNGVIQTMHKRRGEGVQALQPILVIVSDDN